MTRVAIFGLGAMGGGMARSCQKDGMTVHGFDVNKEREAAFLDDGGAPGALVEIAGSLDVVVTVVMNAEQTEIVLFGEDGVVPLLPEGAAILSCATMAPERAKAFAARAAAHGVHYLDSPISGGSIRAAWGELSVMASGPEAGFKAAKPVLDAMARDVFRLGTEIGKGSAMKAVNQVLVGVHIAAMAEAMTFGMSQGLDPAEIAEVIPKCAGTSFAFENRAPHIVKGDYSPHSMIDIWLKDLGIVMDIGRTSKFAAPLTAAALQQYLAASGSGLGGEDDAAVAKVYARNAGLSLPGEP